MKREHIGLLVLCTAALALASCGEESGGKSCTSHADCSEGYRCDLANRVCVEKEPSHCKNKVKDSDESDVDCGGSCAQCAEGKTCAKSGDCATGYCNSETKKCEIKTCRSDTDCGDELKCDKRAGVCFSCTNGIKDGDETDVDCGGNICGVTCENDKMCKEGSDCVYGECKDGKCAGTAPEDAKIDTLVINEVLSEPDTSQKFGTPSSVEKQCDYIEIVNTLDKAQNLTGVELYIVDKSKSSESKEALSGIIPPKGAHLVVGKGCGYEAFKGVTVQEASLSNIMSADRDFDIWLQAGDAKSKVLTHVNRDKGTSSNMDPDRDADGKLNAHDAVNEKLKNSPGYCANGGMFIEDCVYHDPCTNNVKDEGETDVDCGGICGPCANDKACAEDKDCISGACGNTKVCIEKACTEDKDCGGDFVCRDGKCEAKATCEDNILNQDESDVDCGGICGATCDNGRNCNADGDCASGSCMSGVCGGEKPVSASIDMVVINEVLGSPDSNETFVDIASSKSVKQVEFVELVNLTDQKISLDGMNLLLRKEGAETPNKVALGGIVMPHNACLIAAPDVDPNIVNAVPAGVTVLKKKLSIANGSDYDMQLEDSTGAVSEVVIRAKNSTNGLSQTRKIETDPKQEFVFHNDFDPERGWSIHSPGYCANGNLFVNLCKPDKRCSNGTLDEGEADVDCGGVCGAKCETGKKCITERDCVTAYCSGENICAVKPCTSNKECENGICMKDTGICSSCSNGVKDGDETDADCGGSCETKCDINKACVNSADCVTDYCKDNVCLEPRCSSDKDCKDGICNVETGVCSSCSNGQKDGDESDVDCGGSCKTKCGANKSCNIPDDCASTICEESFCMDMPAMAGVNDIVINEIMGSPLTNQTFENSNLKQVEYIELVNLKNEVLALMDLTVILKNSDGGANKEIPLTGVVGAKSAYIITTARDFADIVDKSVTLQYDLKTIANETKYEVYLKDSKGNMSKTVIRESNAKRGISQTRINEADPASKFVLHNTLGDKSKLYSPGMCANGKLHINDCK